MVPNKVKLEGVSHLTFMAYPLDRCGSPEPPVMLCTAVVSNGVMAAHAGPTPITHLEHIQWR